MGLFPKPGVLNRTKKFGNLFSLSPEDALTPGVNSDDEESTPSGASTMEADSMPDPSPTPSSNPSSLYGYKTAAPAPHQSKWWEKLIDVGLNSIAGLKNGKGLIPGAAEGLMANRDYMKKENDTDLANWRKNEEFAQKDREITALGDYTNRQLDIAQQNADTKTAKTGPADKKLQDIDSYASTLNDQIHKMIEDAGQIPGYGLGTGSIAAWAGHSGQAPWSGAQTDFEAKQTPISDVLAKMTSGRANQQIIKNISDQLKVLETGSSSQKAAAGPAILDYIDTEYRNSQLAHGVAPENVKSLTDLNATANTIPSSSGRVQPGTKIGKASRDKVLSYDPLPTPPAGAIKIKGSDGNMWWGDPKTKTVYGRVK